MLQRIKEFFSRKPVDPDAIEWIPVPDVDAVPDDAESDIPLPPVILDALRKWPASPVGEAPVVATQDRFQVLRVADGVTYQAYQGDDGTKALEAWEAYQASSLAGEFTFIDRQHPAGHRGTFSRGTE